MAIFTWYLFVASIDLCNRNTEPYHSGSRVLEMAIYRGGFIVTSTTTLPLNVHVTRIQYSYSRNVVPRNFTQQCIPPVLYSPGIPPRQKALCTTIFWHLSAPMIARIACLMASVDSRLRLYRMHPVPGRAPTRLL